MVHSVTNGKLESPSSYKQKTERKLTESQSLCKLFDKLLTEHHYLNYFIRLSELCSG